MGSIRIRSRLSKTLVVVLLILSSAVGAAQKANGAPGDATSAAPTAVTAESVNDSDGWTARAQNTVMAALGALYDATGHTDAYTDLGVDYIHKYVVLYSHGLPDVDWTSSQRALSGTGFTLVQVETAYGLAAISNILRAMYTALKATDASGIAVIGANDDYSGITVNGPKLAEDAARQAAILNALRGVAPSGMPISFKDAGMPIPLARLNDTAPYIGGARLNVPDGICTSGFALHNGATHYLTTAAHCANYANGTTFHNGAGAAFGTAPLGTNSWTGVLFDTNHLDDTLIYIPNGTHQIYVGGYNSSSYDNVAGIQPWAKNTDGCLSGSVSGLRCYVRRSGSDAFMDVAVDGSWVIDVYSTHNTQIAAHGDSGGPGFYPSNFMGTASIHAAVSGDPATIVPCDSQTDPNQTAGNTCYNEIYVTPMNRVEDALAPYGIAFDHV